jgi:hypothetical protein
MRLSIRYQHCDPLSISRHRMLNLPEKRLRRATLAEHQVERWAGAYQSSRKQNTLYLVIRCKFSIKFALCNVRLFYCIFYISSTQIIKNSDTVF